MSFLPLVLAMLAAPAAARDDEPGGDFLIAGMGPVLLPDYEGSNDYRVLPVPGVIGRVGGYSFVYLGNSLSVDLLRDRPGSGWDVELGPALTVGFGRSASGPHDPRIRALTPVGTAVTLGGYVGIARQGVNPIAMGYDRLSLSVDVEHDVAGGHGGTLVTPQINYMTPVSAHAMIALVALGVHADDHYADALFTVTPADSAASGLPAYSARGGWKSWSLGLAADVSLTGDLKHGLSAIGGVLYTRLLDDFAASPVTSIAGSRDQWMAGLGLAYTF